MEKYTLCTEYFRSPSTFFQVRIPTKFKFKASLTRIIQPTLSERTIIVSTIRRHGYDESTHRRTKTDPHRTRSDSPRRLDHGKDHTEERSDKRTSC